MYKPWQDATSLPIELKSPWYNHGEWTMPSVSASAVRDSAGQVHVGLANLDPNKAVTVSATLAGLTATSAGGTILTAPVMNAYNSFDRPNTLTPQPFSGADVKGDTLTVTLPAKSVVVLDLK